MAFFKLEFSELSKSTNFKIFFQFVKQKFSNFGIFQIGNFWNFPNLAFSDLEILGIVKINKFLDFFFQSVKQKFSNFEIVQNKNFVILQIGYFWNFSNLAFSKLEIFGTVKINKFLDFFSICKTKI